MTFYKNLADLVPWNDLFFFYFPFFFVKWMWQKSTTFLNGLGFPVCNEFISFSFCSMGKGGILKGCRIRETDKIRKKLWVKSRHFHEIFLRLTALSISDHLSLLDDGEKFRNNHSLLLEKLNFCCFHRGKNHFLNTWLSH